MITPLSDFVVIEEVKKENNTGIILPVDADVEPSFTGTVIAVGEGVKRPLKEGDTVLFKRYGFEEVEVEKRKLLVGQESHIFAKC